MHLFEPGTPDFYTAHMTGNKRGGGSDPPLVFHVKKLLNQNRESTVKVLVCERQMVQFNTGGEEGAGSFLK